MKEETYNNLGKSIHVFNNIELYLNYIITHHIEPKNRDFFLDNILNTSVISFGAKIKILINLNIFTQSNIDKIRDYSSNRNVFAHSNREDYYLEGIVENKEKREITINLSDVIFKTNSNGKLKKMNYQDFIKQHKKLQNEIIDLICDYITINNINTNFNHVENLRLYKL